MPAHAETLSLLSIQLPQSLIDTDCAKSFPKAGTPVQRQRGAAQTLSKIATQIPEPATDNDCAKSFPKKGGQVERARNGTSSITGSRSRRVQVPNS